MSDAVPGMAPVAPSLPSRSDMKYIGTLCCDKAKWGIYKGMVVTACPDHLPTSDFKALEAWDGSKAR